MTEEADSNLYINPLEVTDKCGTNKIKKSISGEVGRSIDTSLNAESLKEASKANLNDIIPKHRKIRIQQVSFLKIIILYVFVKYPFILLEISYFFILLIYSTVLKSLLICSMKLLMKLILLSMKSIKNRRIRTR